MTKLCSYFVKDSKKLIPSNKYIIKGANYRFTVLSPRLIRIEYNKTGVFEDRATSLVVNRTFNDFTYGRMGEDPGLTISTEYLNNIIENLRIEKRNKTFRSCY